MTDDRTFERLEAELRESWLIRGANVIAGACATSLEQSGTVGALHRMRSAWRLTPANARVRAMATGVAVATLGHVALMQVVPPSIAPAVPRLLWVLVAATSLTVAALATPVTHAWSTSVVGRVWRAMTPTGS